MLSNDEQSPPYQLPTDPVLATAIPSATSSHVLPWWEFSLVFGEDRLGALVPNGQQ